MMAGILSQPPNGRTDNYPLPTLRWKMVLGKLEVVTQNIFQVLKNRTPFQLLAQCLLTIGHHKSTVLVWEINSFKLVYNHLVKGCKFGFPQSTQTNKNKHKNADGCFGATTGTGQLNSTKLKLHYNGYCEVLAFLELLPVPFNWHCSIILRFFFFTLSHSPPEPSLVPPLF